MKKNDTHYQPFSAPCLPQEVIVEFQQLYKKEYGTNILYEEASRRAHYLIKLYGAVYETGLEKIT
ncbi:MAG: hypothetical protein UY04_C0003G0036 [Parcubacteria group bacterium GW2011_GWA2_47_7]|nr:MAG: hypothetical protein UY04_C0003G0036 [Parcubacteria group bacterium GW2011_GWA2_47_7]